MHQTDQTTDLLCHVASKSYGAVKGDHNPLCRAIQSDVPARPVTVVAGKKKKKWVSGRSRVSQLVMRSTASPQNQGGAVQTQLVPTHAKVATMVVSWASIRGQASEPQTIFWDTRSGDLLQ